MLPIRKCLSDVLNFAKTAKAELLLKQDKDWIGLGSTEGTLRYDISHLTEVSVNVGYGGVWHTATIPIRFLPRTLNIGYYGNVIYVRVTPTEAYIEIQPQDYTATIQMYAR